MIRAYKSYWKNYFNFKERTSRKDFWLVVLATIIVSMIIGFLSGFFLRGELVELQPDMSNLVEYLKSPIMLVSCIWGLINLIPGIAICVRRLHDANFSGWFYLLCFVPIVGGIIILIFMLLPTNEEGQRFGIYA